MNSAGCGSDDVQEIIDDLTPEPDKIVKTFTETEPNDTPDNANNIDFFPEDTTVTLQVRGNVTSDINVDNVDFYSFVLSSPGTYNFRLSELTLFNLNFAVISEEGLTNPIDGVNAFRSDINAPDDGPVESFTANLSAGILYYILVTALDTNDQPYFYTVFVEKTK